MTFRWSVRGRSPWRLHTSGVTDGSLLNDAEALIGHVDDGQQTGDTLSKNGSLADMKREYLSTMSVRVPLLSSSDSGRKQFLATKVQAVLVNQTKELSIHTFEDRFERLVKRGVSPAPSAR